MLSNARQAVGRALEPVARGLIATGVTPNTITLLGLVGTLVAAWLIADGRFGLGAAVFIPATFLDLFDGMIARRMGTASRWGAFVDSIADRVGESAVLVAIAYRFRDVSPRVSGVALGALVFSYLVSYVKARAESLGYRCEGGFAERPERAIVMGAGLLLGIMEAAMWALGALAAFTVVQRIVIVRRQPAERAPSSG